MVGLLVAQEMVNREVRFDRNESTLLKYVWRPPRRDEVSIAIEEGLLDNSASIEMEIRIEVGHPLRFVSGLQ